MTIVIPAKNEAKLVPNLLTSLVLQDYKLMPSTKVYLADANSTDGTADVALMYAGWLDIAVIPGGLPSVGRNAGARRACTPYVLFIDADIEISDPTLVRRAVELMKSKNLHCVTTNIACPTGSAWDRILYRGNNLMQQLSRLYKPFSTGMFMLFDRGQFNALGGFHEQALYAEDYLLSQKIAPGRFAIVSGAVLTTNRRLIKMGHFKLVRLFLNTALHTRHESFFLRDHKYWQSET
ncbi:MAG TPA: glycosyltransferase family A protein [Terriglobales bacterium]|nr:glycosyltransferase family A protein [Terriglobales bacterium]